MRRTSTRRPAGFTLIELLVVIGIIALLAGILFPTIRKMRIASQEADSRNLLNQIDQACQAYYMAERAYPGPLPNSLLDAANQSTLLSIYEINTAGTGAGSTQINNNIANVPAAGNQTGSATFGAITTGNGGGRITGAENLVLGLCGGLAIDRTANSLYIDPSAIGQGPISLNTAKIGRTSAYIETKSMTTGKVTDEGGALTGVDSIIPEFVDRFSTPMPILYMRSTKQGTSTGAAAQNLVSNSPNNAGDYCIVQIQPYTSYPTGGTKTHGLTSANPEYSIHKGIQNSGVTYRGPLYDAYDYLVEPSSYDPAKTTLTVAEYAAKQTRKKDSYVLISAGRDRIYGTEDDIVNFGSVLP